LIWEQTNNRNKHLRSYNLSTTLMVSVWCEAITWLTRWDKRIIKIQLIIVVRVCLLRNILSQVIYYFLTNYFSMPYKLLHYSTLIWSFKNNHLYFVKEKKTQKEKTWKFRYKLPTLKVHNTYQVRIKFRN